MLDDSELSHEIEFQLSRYKIERQNEILNNAKMVLAIFYNSGLNYYLLNLGRLMSRMII